VTFPCFGQCFWQLLRKTPQLRALQMTLLRVPLKSGGDGVESQGNDALVVFAFGTM
jgi:hypothetical protein